MRFRQKFLLSLPNCWTNCLEYGGVYMITKKWDSFSLFHYNDQHKKIDI